MASSISTSKTEWKVVATVLIVLIGWELVARRIAPTLDYDREHIAQFPTITKTLHDGPSPRVLFLGNSLTMWGIDTDIIANELATLDAPPSALASMRPVGTAVADWVHLYRSRIVDTGRTPDIVVLGFVAHHLPDVPPVKIRRRARHFCNAAALGDLITRDLHTFGDRAEAALSYPLACFGDQPEHAEHVLNWIVPGWRDGTRRVTRVLEDVAERRVAADGRPPPATYEGFRQLVASMAASGARGIVVAMPLPRMWELSDEIVQIVTDAGLVFIDARQIEGIDNDSFSDGYHLGESGTNVYSRFMARELLPYLQAPPAGD